MRAIFRTFIMVATMLAIVCPMSAQTLQKGVVQEYKGKSKKTPLSNVELNVVNANSTVSDKKGRYELQFRTLKPGNKVNVRKIEKLGYEIFNKEALEQWYISSQNESFTIVMVRCEDMKKLRDEYSRVSSKSYERQYNRDKKKLEEERKQNKITQQEYENKIIKLEEEYDYQLTQLDNYVDRFSRIDLSELSKEEQEIIELVRQGEIDEAIKRYEELGIDAKIHKTADEKSEIDHAIATLNSESSKKSKELDQLFTSLANMFDTYLLRGGQDGYKKIVETCFSIAENDNINWKYKLELAEFLKDADRITILELIDFNEIDNIDKYFYAREIFLYSTLLCGQIDKANEQAQIMLAKANEQNILQYKIQAELALAEIYEQQMQDDKAFEIYTKYTYLLEESDNESNVILSNNLKVNISDAMCGYYERYGNYTEAMKYAEISYNLCFDEYEREKTFKSETDAAQHIVVYATILRQANVIDKSLNLLISALPFLEEGWNKYPRMYFSIYKGALDLIAQAYFSKQQFKEAEMMFIKELTIVKDAKSMNIDTHNMPILVTLYNNLGYLYFTMGEIEKSERAYIQGIEEGRQLLEINFGYTVDAIFRPGINITTLYNSIENYEKAKQYGSEAFKYCELLYSNYPDAYINEYILILKELAIADMNLDSCDSALEFIEKAIQVFPANSYDTSSFLTNNYAELLDVKGQILLKKGDNDGAAEMMKKIKKADANYDSQLSKMLAK